MLLQRAWSEEAKRFGLTFGALLAVGVLLGHPLAFAALAPVVHLVRVAVDLRRILAWLHHEPDALAPDTVGFSAQIASAWISERRRTSEEIAAYRGRIERVQAAIHALPDAIVDLDEELGITWCNEAGTQLLGIRMDDDAGHPIVNLVRNPAFVDLVDRARTTEAVMIPSPNDPTRQLSVRLVGYGSDQAVLLARDETDAIRLDKVRQDFVANVSHELKTPLAVLSGYAETLGDAQASLPDRWHRPVAAMQGQIARMARLVDELLYLSRTESTTRPSVLEAIDISRLLAQVVEEAKVLSAGRHRIESTVQTEDILHGDESELRTAFMNLVANAVQHTPEGGRITVRWYRTPQGVCFEVSDSGQGIDSAHLSRLTERFYRVDPGRSRDQGGTGLGLAIVKHVLQHYDATLEIRSNVGEGSTFSCRFPRQRAGKHSATQVA